MGLKINLQATFPASVSLANSGILKRPDIVDAAGGFFKRIFTDVSAIFNSS
jgi:hypothetical protein